MPVLGFLLIAVFSYSSDTWIPPEDMTVKALAASSQNGSLVLLTSFFKPKLTVFDFKKGKALAVDDGRFRQYMAFPLAYQDGFAIIGRMVKTIYFMDGAGRFVSQKPFSEIKGWQDGFKIEHASPFGYHRALLTLSQVDKPIWVLAELDLETWQIQILTEGKKDERYIEHWVAGGERIFRFNYETGNIHSIDPKTFKKGSIIQAGRDPVERPKQRRGRSPYFARLEAPTSLDGTLYFPLFSFTEQLEKERGCLVVSKNGLETLSELPYGVYEDQWLVLDLADLMFRLGERPKQMRGNK